MSLKYQMIMKNHLAMKTVLKKILQINCICFYEIYVQRDSRYCVWTTNTGRKVTLIQKVNKYLFLLNIHCLLAFTLSTLSSVWITWHCISVHCKIFLCRIGVFLHPKMCGMIHGSLQALWIERKQKLKHQKDWVLRKKIVGQPGFKRYLPNNIHV